MSFNPQRSIRELDEEIEVQQAMLQSLAASTHQEAGARGIIERDLEALRREREDKLHPPSSSGQESLPTLPPLRRSLFSSNSVASGRTDQMRPPDFPPLRPQSTLSHNGPRAGFSPYANSHDAAFGGAPASDGAVPSGTMPPLSSLLAAGPSSDFRGARTSKYGQDGQTQQHNSPAATPAASSSGSAAATPSSTSTGSSPVLPPMSQKNLKRVRNSSDASPHSVHQPAKAMRHSASPGGNLADTPPSHTSTDTNSDLPDHLLELIGGNPREELRRMKEAERELEERRELERRDEEFARELERDLNGGGTTYQASPPHAGPSSYTQNPTQTLLDPTGGFRRPSRPLFDDTFRSGSQTPLTSGPSSFLREPSVQRSFMDSRQPRSPIPSIKPEYSQQGSFANIGPSPFEAQSRAYGTNRAGFVDVGSESDSDQEISITDGTGFVPRQRQNNSYYGTMSRQQDSSRPNTGSSAFDNASVADLTGSSPFALRPHDIAQGVHGVPSSSVYGQDMNVPQGSSAFDPLRQGYSAARAAVFGLLDHTANGLSNTMSAYTPSSNPYDQHTMPGSWGPGVGSSMNPFNIDDEFPSNHPYWNNRYNDYVQADPTKTLEELRDLMNNIRPDEELGLSDKTGSPEDMAEGCGLYEHQKLGLSWMIGMEEGSNKGGILADDMGLGKTIQAIALMVSQRSKNTKCKTTLIIAPVALLKQWENEIKIKVKADRRLSTYIYHGTKKNTSWEKLRTYDIILTTYGTLASEMGRKDRIDLAKRANPNWLPTTNADRLPLLGDECKFFRVILDEAQNIKNRNTKQAVATYAIKADRRFCMTGTPMMNNTTELFSLVHFLRIRPYCEWERFNKDFVRPLRGENVTNTDEAMRRLQAFLKAILLRRTKKSEINGAPILTLPERVTTIDHAVFDEEQFNFYHDLEQKTANRFNRYQEAGTVGRNYSNALVLLLRLRQACCHPHLIRDYDNGVPPSDLSVEDLEKIAADLSLDTVRRIKEEGLIDCPICMDVVENSTIFLPCGHRTCSECFARISDPSQVIDDSTGNGEGKVFKCMTCRGNVNPRKVTDWASFKKVHMPEPSEEIKKDPEAGIETESESGSDSDSDTDSDDESESDEDETLGGFIVNDEVAEASDDDLDLDLGSSPKPKPTLESKGKGKAKADKSDKKDKKDKKKRKGKKSKKSKGKGKEKLDKVKKTLSELQKEGRRNQKAKMKYIKRLRETWISSAKVDKCMEILDQIQEREGHEKTIVFSQFTTMLDLLEVPICDRGWGYKRYDGSMSATSRNDAVIEFTGKRNCKIMLVSLKAGNSGLNLTAANNVVIFDPFWNPYIEEQAVDRAHRIGQRRTVQVHRLLVQETVEDRIIQLQDKKRAMIEGALDENASRSIARLGQRELAFLFGVQSAV